MSDNSDSKIKKLQTRIKLRFNDLSALSGDLGKETLYQGEILFVKATNGQVKIMVGQKYPDGSLMPISALPYITSELSVPDWSKTDTPEWENFDVDTFLSGLSTYVSSYVQEYAHKPSGSTTDTISVAVSQDNVIAAVLKSGSVSSKHLDDILKGQIDKAAKVVDTVSVDDDGCLFVKNDVIYGPQQTSLIAQIEGLNHIKQDFTQISTQVLPALPIINQLSTILSSSDRFDGDDAISVGGTLMDTIKINHIKARKSPITQHHDDLCAEYISKIDVDEHGHVVSGEVRQMEINQLGQKRGQKIGFACGNAIEAEDWVEYNAWGESESENK